MASAAVRPCLPPSACFPPTTSEELYREKQTKDKSESELRAQVPRHFFGKARLENYISPRAGSAPVWTCKRSSRTRIRLQGCVTALRAAPRDSRLTEPRKTGAAALQKVSTAVFWENGCFKSRLFDQNSLLPLPFSHVLTSLFLQSKECVDTEVSPDTGCSV